MLKRRHYNIGDNLDCLLCGEHIEETVEHLFFHCNFSQRCWRVLNITWSNHLNRLQLVEHMKTSHQRKMLMETFLVAAWSLWKERNNNYFRRVTPSITSWKNRFKEDFGNIAYRLPTQKRQLVLAILEAVP